MRRRQFIGALAGVAACPLAVRAQQPQAMRRIGVLMSLAADDVEGQARHAAFLQGLRDLGWNDRENVRIDTRWSGGDADSSRKLAAELIGLAPDVILVSGNSVAGVVIQATRTIPVVFTQTPDPVGAGFVESLARPGRNVTGFTQSEFGVGAQWLDLLKQTAPIITRVAVIRDATISAGIGQLGAMQAVAPSFGVELSALSVRDADEIEHAIAAFARLPSGGLVITSSGLANVHRELIIRAAARYKLPAIYPNRLFVTDGGLISYGADSREPHRRAASYVDRILKGENPAELPVQTPTKYELLVNTKTAEALGLTIPASLLARADEVIE